MKNIGKENQLFRGIRWAAQIPMKYQIGLRLGESNGEMKTIGDEKRLF